MKNKVFEMDQRYFTITKMDDYKTTPPVKRIHASSSNQKYMCFITNYPLPYAAVWGSNSFEAFGPLEKCSEIPKCLCIDGKNDETSLVATGYESGNIYLFQPNNKNFLRKIVRNNQENPRIAPISAIKFAEDYKSIVACDRLGGIFQITNISTVIPNEVTLYSGHVPLKNVFMPSTDSPYAIFSDNNSVNILDIKSQDYADIASSPFGESIYFDAKRNQDGTSLVIVWNGNNFSMFKISSFTQITPLFEYCFPVTIKEAIIRKNYVVTIIFTDGSMDLVIGSTRPRLESYLTDEIKRIVKIYHVWTKSHETLFMLTSKSMFRIKFIEWDERLEKLFKADDWPLCFSMAEGIYTGSNLQVFGVEPDPAKRCLLLQKKMFTIYSEALDGSGDEVDRIAQIFDSAAACNMQDFIINTAYNRFKDEGDRIMLFYEAIFSKMRRNITKYIPCDFFVDYLSRSIDNKTDSETIKCFIKKGIPKQYGRQLLKLAIKCDSMELLLTLWTQCFDDFITPCIYLLKNDKLIDYMSDIFIQDKYHLLKLYKELLTIWFCTEQNGSYPRLLLLFSKNWELAPKFAQAFVDQLPIELRNDGLFSYPKICDAILRTASCAPEKSLPTIDVIAELIPKYHVKIPRSCISCLIKWAFETNITSTIIRESIVMLIHDQHPDIIDYSKIIDYCEATGFAKIANFIYLPSRSYDKVIQTMAMSEEYRQYIFAYVKNPYLDPLRDLEKKQIEEKHEEEEDVISDSNDEDESSDDNITKIFGKINKMVDNIKENVNTIADNPNLKADEIKNKIIGTLTSQSDNTKIPASMKNAIDDFSDETRTFEEEEEEENSVIKIEKNNAAQQTALKKGESEQTEEEEEEENEEEEEEEEDDNEPKRAHKKTKAGKIIIKVNKSSSDDNSSDYSSSSSSDTSSSSRETLRKQKKKSKKQKSGQVAVKATDSDNNDNKNNESSNIDNNNEKSIKPEDTDNNKDKIDFESYTIKDDPIMQDVIKNYLKLFVLINAAESAELIGRYYPEYARLFIKKEPDLYVKFLYLRAFVETEYVKLLTEEDHFELFELTCKYSPPDVLPMIKSSQTIEIDKALPICTKYRVIDACIHIHTMLGDMQSAVNLVAEELEADLVEAILSKHHICAPSIDLVKEEPELQKAYQTVVITFELLSKAPNQLTDRMWKDIFLSFQLPLYIIQPKNLDSPESENELIQDVDPDTRRSICYFFAFFIVETLSQNRSSPENIFTTYQLQFKEINQILYRTALSAVFKYIDYNQKLADTVVQLLMEDCINLYDRAQLTKTKAAFVYNTNCQFCNTPITGAGGVGALVFECGHAYHDDQKCGQHRSTCMVCKGELQISSKQEPPAAAPSQRAQNMKLRKLMRVDHGLRRNYGKDQDLSDSGNNVFFFFDYPVQAKQYSVLKQPENWPEIKNLFLEL